MGLQQHERRLRVTRFGVQGIEFMATMLVRDSLITAQGKA